MTLNRCPEFVLGTEALPNMSERQARIILRAAVHVGVPWVAVDRFCDQTLVGQALYDVSRQHRMSVVIENNDAGLADSREHAGRLVQQTLRRLRRERIDIAFVPQSLNTLDPSAALWRVLHEERSNGTVGGLGRSVDTVAGAIKALTDPLIDLVQINDFSMSTDWCASAITRAFALRPAVSVHVVIANRDVATIDAALRLPWVHGVTISPSCAKDLALALDTFKRRSLTRSAAVTAVPVMALAA